MSLTRPYTLCVRVHLCFGWAAATRAVKDHKESGAQREQTREPLVQVGVYCVEASLPRLTRWPTLSLAGTSLPAASIDCVKPLLDAGHVGGTHADLELLLDEERHGSVRASEHVGQPEAAQDAQHRHAGAALSTTLRDGLHVCAGIGNARADQEVQITI